MTTGALGFKSKTVCKIIVACAVLHNKCIDAGMLAPFDLDGDDSDDDDINDYDYLNEFREAQDGVTLRNRVVRGFEWKFIEPEVKYAIKEMDSKSHCSFFY